MNVATYLNDVKDIDAVRYMNHSTGIILPQSYVLHNESLPDELFVAAAQVWNKFQVGDVIHDEVHDGTCWMWLCISPPYYCAGEFYVPVLGPGAESLGDVHDLCATLKLHSYRCTGLMTPEFRLQIVNRAMSAENTPAAADETWEETLSNILIRSACNLGVDRYPLFPLCNPEHWACDKTVVAKPPTVDALQCTDVPEIYVPNYGIGDAQYDILKCANISLVAKTIRAKALRRYLFLQLANDELVLIDFCTREIHMFDSEFYLASLLDEILPGFRVHGYPAANVKGNAWAHYIGTLLSINTHIIVRDLLQFFSTVPLEACMASWLESTVQLRAL